MVLWDMGVPDIDRLGLAELPRLLLASHHSLPPQWSDNIIYPPTYLASRRLPEIGLTACAQQSSIQVDMICWGLARLAVSPQDRKVCKRK